MKKKPLALLGALFFACVAAGIAESKGFDSNSLSQDYPMPNLPSPAAPPSLSQETKTPTPVTVETPPPSPLLASPPSMPSVPPLDQKMPSLNKQGSFKMPHFTDRSLEYRAQQNTPARKKRNLWEEIEYEVTHYGLFLLLGFAVVLLVYALRREAAEHAAPPEVKVPEKPGEEKKTIWEDRF